MEPVLERSRLWTHTLVALGGFILGMAMAQWSTTYTPGRSRVVWPDPPHPRQIQP